MNVCDVGSSSFDYAPFINAVNLLSIRDHIEFFSSLGTRATGYLGNELAAQYIYEKFIEYGLVNVTYQVFEVVDCISYGANVTIIPTGECVKIHPFIPNLVCPSTTPPEGIVGKLVYVGRGELKDFNGKDIEGNIVLMDWNAGSNWIWAAQLGAKAVIFLPPSYFLGGFYGVTSWTSAFSTPGPATRFLWDTPINFPRFYAEESEAQKLLRAEREGLEVRLISTQRWAKVTGKNIIGFIEGGIRPDGIIMLCSYYDSYSEVPTVAPGAQESIGISVLLELARYLAQRAHEGDRPPLTLMFVAFGGHHQALAGATAFADRYLYFPRDTPNWETKREFGSRIWRAYGFDISTGSSFVYLTNYGTGTWANNIVKHLAYVTQGVFKDEVAKYQATLERYIRELQQQFPGKYEVYSKIGWSWNEDISISMEPNIMPTKKWAFDTEIFKYIGPYALTFTTGYDARPYYWTPFDTIDKINWSNLKLSLESIYAILLRTLSECLDEYYEWYGREPVFKFYIKTEGGALDYNTWEAGNEIHWGEIYGKLAIYDEDLAFWRPLTRADIGNLTGIVYFRTHAATDRRFFLVEDDGSFRIRGHMYYRFSDAYRISGWVIDPTTGNVVFAPDMGPRAYKPPIKIFGDIGFLSVFRASSIAILDAIHPLTLGIPEIETGAGFIRPQPEFTVYEAEKYVPPFSYGVWVDPNMYHIALIAFPPETPVIITAKVSVISRYPFICLTNGSESNLLGWGYKLKLGEQEIIHFPILQYAKDFYYMNLERINVIKGFTDLSTHEGYKLHSECEDFIQKAIFALESKDYATAYVYAIDAWLRGCSAYTSLRTYIEDAIAVTPIFALLILPFTFLCEKLLFNWSGYKKILSLVGVFGFCTLALILSHPGFSLAASPAHVIIGFSVLILSAPIIFLIFSRAGELVKELRVRAVGMHEIKVSRFAQATYAFSVGVENMRKRKLRTILALFTVIVVVSSIASFTAISALQIYIPISRRASEDQVLHGGVYVRKSMWGYGGFSLSRQLQTYIEARYGDEAIILRRAWRYTIFPSMLAQYGTIGFTIIYEGKRLSLPPKALLGVTIEEAELMHMTYFLSSGSRWFIPGEYLSCILGEGLARELGIDPNALPVNVTIEGITFNVVGILQKGIESIKDLDGEEITPVKRDYATSAENPWNEHLTLNEIVIMPFETVLDMGGGVATLSIIPIDKATTENIAKGFYEGVKGFLTFYNIGDSIHLLTQASSIIIGGAEIQIIPIVIVILNLTSLMLAAIHERRRELSIYSAVGLAPIHVALMFIAEALVYGVIGSVLGYLSALIAYKLIGSTVGIWLNFSSSIVVLAILLAIAAIAISSIYPAFLSARLVTPSLERKWRVPTKPIGDRWVIPLPFVASSEDEARGIIRYLAEYLVQHELPDAPVFMATNIDMEEGVRDEKRFMAISADCRLAPYHVGIIQRASIAAVEEMGGVRWSFHMTIERVMGAYREWERLNRDFVDEVRKQLLLWRTLPMSEKARYIGVVSK